MYSRRSYFVDLRRWVVANLPSAIRKRGVLHVVWALLAPLRMWQSEFERRKGSNDLRARHDTSIGNLRRLLNALYDPTGRRIAVVENFDSAAAKFRIYVTDSLEEDSALCGYADGDDRCYLDADIQAALVSILVPWDIWAKERDITSTARGYILPGIKFEVVKID